MFFLIYGLNKFENILYNNNTISKIKILIVFMIKNDYKELSK